MSICVFGESSETFANRIDRWGGKVLEGPSLVAESEWVTFTYEDLRDDVGDTIAYFDEDYDGWAIMRYIGDEIGFFCSDLIIRSD